MMLSNCEQSGHHCMLTVAGKQIKMHCSLYYIYATITNSMMQIKKQKTTHFVSTENHVVLRVCNLIG